MYNIAIFASGTGSNAAEIIRFFNQSNEGNESGNIEKNNHTNKENAINKVTLIVTNRQNAGVLQHASSANIPTWVIDKQIWGQPKKVICFLHEKNIDFIVLAGFLWKIAPELCAAYPNKITNIHPSLLPKYGGKGMYGAHVHQAVLDNNETESGVTIHYVNENYDEGNIILQAKCPVFPDDTVDSLSKRIQLLELKHYKTVLFNIFNEI